MKTKLGSKIKKYLCTKKLKPRLERRNRIINSIFEIYIKHFSENYIDALSNDLPNGSVGEITELYKKKDVNGIKLWNEIAKNTTDKNKIISFLREIPFFYLLSIYGTTCDRFNAVKLNIT